MSIRPNIYVSCDGGPPIRQTNSLSLTADRSLNHIVVRRGVFSFLRALFSSVVVGRTQKLRCPVLSTQLAPSFPTSRKQQQQKDSSEQDRFGILTSHAKTFRLETMANLRDGLLVGCGNPLLDISASVDQEFLAKYDMLPNNAILAEDKHMPIYKELIEKYKAEYIAGGSVQNSFRVAQWILQRPKVAVFFGCVGQDKYSEILSEKASSDGVNVQYQFCKDSPTGTCAVLITGTQRSLCANLAAANNFTVDHLTTAENEKYLQGAEYFYISGFFLTVSVESILTVAKRALAQDRLFMMNLSAPFIPQFFKDNLDQVFPYIDIIFGNETEALAFAEKQELGTEDLKEIGLKMSALPKQNSARGRVVIITQGSDPVLLIQDGKITEYPVEKLATEQIVDTNGAGDAFVGGFLAQLVQKESYETCIKCGIWAARQIIQRSGCTFEGVPTFKA